MQGNPAALPNILVLVNIKNCWQKMLAHNSEKVLNLPSNVKL
jgi:hypothetical protein